MASQVECLADHVEKAAMENTGLGLDASTRARVGRTSGVFLHDEGALTFLAACREKVGYTTGIAAFHRKYGSRALASHLRRPYFEHPSSLLAQATLGLSVLALKGGEAVAVVVRLLLDKGFEAGAQGHCRPNSAQVIGSAITAIAPVAPTMARRPM
jgi:hypothetical protein